MIPIKIPEFPGQPSGPSLNQGLECHSWMAPQRSSYPTPLVLQMGRLRHRVNLCQSEGISADSTSLSFILSTPGLKDERLPSLKERETDPKTDQGNGRGVLCGGPSIPKPAFFYSRVLPQQEDRW